MLGSFPTLKHGIRRFVKTFDTVGNKAVFFFVILFKELKS